MWIFSEPYSIKIDTPTPLDASSNPKSIGVLRAGSGHTWFPIYCSAVEKPARFAFISHSAPSPMVTSRAKSGASTTAQPFSQRPKIHSSRKKSVWKLNATSRTLAFAGSLCVAAAAYWFMKTDSYQKPYDPFSMAPVFGYTKIRELPHDIEAFTQGLVYQRVGEQDVLWESSGGFSTSELRMVDLDSGRVLKRVQNPEFFAEGIAIRGTNLYQLSWRSKFGVVYDIETLEEARRWSYGGEGWGFAYVPRESSAQRTVDTFYMSDGSDTLRILDAESLEEIGRVHVKDGNRTVPLLNELQFVRGELWANIWGSGFIARVDPESGRVRSWVNFQGILKAEQVRDYPGLRVDVFNGIAFDDSIERGQRVFVTGKRWPLVFEIQVNETEPIAKSILPSKPFFYDESVVERVQASMKF